MNDSKYKLRNKLNSIIMMDFDERSGIADCITPWGRWWQTLTELHVEVNVPEGTKSKDVCCEIKAKKLSLAVHGETLFKVSKSWRSITNRLLTVAPACSITLLPAV